MSSLSIMPKNPDLSSEEMRVLASDIREEKVFTSGHLPLDDASLLNQIFMDFLWLSKPQQEEIEGQGGVGMVYQYRDVAMEGSTLCGYPRFHKSYWLTPEQTVTINTIVLGYNS